MRLFIAATLVLAATAMTSAQSKQIVRSGPDLGLPFSPAVKAGGLIYVSGSVATDAKGAITATDIRTQTRQTLENISHVLESAGSRLANAASVMVYITDASDFAAMNDVYKTFWPKDPPARTTIVAPLALAGARIEISMVAVPDGAERQVILPADWIRSPNPYSYGIKTGDTLFLSGLVSRNGKDNSHVTGDITTQTHTVLDNGGQILKAAGMSYADVVSARVFITDTANFQAMNTAYRAHFPAAPPARATVRCGLTTPDYLIEVTMVAVRDASRTAVTTPNADGTPGTANPNLSAAIRVGRRLYLSGMLGTTPGNTAAVGAQTTEAFARIDRTLKAAGFDLSDVVEGMVYLTDMGHFPDMNSGYRQAFGKDFPARTTVGAGLMGAGGLVEIMLTAVK